MTTLTDRRPDLLALRFGYAAQDEGLRAAILSQFPDLILGATGSSDSSKVINIGPNAQVGLPLFDRNGAISPSPAPPVRSFGPSTPPA